MANQIVSIDPTTGKEIATYELYSEKKIESSLKQADKTYADWRTWPFSKRAVVLRNIAKEIRKEKDRLVKLAVQELELVMRRVICAARSGRMTP